VLEAISEFSSPGPTRDGRVKPELAAPGERVWGAMSEEAHPCRSPHSIYRYHGFAECDALLTEETAGHGFGLLQGTSFAAPVVTGLAARVLSTNGGLDAVQVRNVLVNSALVDAYTGVVPNEEWGYGKADLTVGGATLPEDLRIETYALPPGYLDEPFRAALVASGGRLPYAWSLDAGSLPPGLTLDAHGLVAGQPASVGDYDLTVAVTDGSLPAQVSNRALRLTVSAEPPLEILTAVLPPARLDGDYSESLEGRGGTPPYAWSLIGGTLPAGLALSPSGGVSGVPTAVGRFHFTIGLTDAAAAVAYRAVRIHVVRDVSDLWQPLGIVATEITRLAVDPNDVQRLFAATDNTFDPSQNAVYRSVDSGERWEPVSINNGFFDADNWDGVTWVAVSPADSRAWATHEGGVGGRVLRYDEAAKVWDTTLEGCRDPSVVDFDDAGSLYLYCASTRSFRRSTDNGASWQVIGQMCGGDIVIGGGLHGSLSVHRADPTRMYAIHHGITGGAVSTYTCRSTDGGATWSEAGRLSTSSSSYLEVQVSQSNPDDVVRTVEETFNQYAERSVDGGLTWSRSLITAQGFSCCLRRAPSDPAVLLYGSSGGLFRSLDAGQTWSRVTVKGFATLDVTSIVFDPTDATRFYVGSTSGLFYTADGGATWSQKNRGLVRRPLTGMSMSRLVPNDVLLATSMGEPYLSRTMGDKWTATGVSLSGHGLLFPAISGADPNLYYVVGDGMGVYRSENRGLDWTNVSPPVTFGWSVQYLAADPLNADNLLIWISGNDVLRSTDRGATWTEVSNPGFLGPESLAYAHDVPDRVFGAWGWDGVFRSSDGGVTWQEYGFNGGSISIGLVTPAPSNSEYLYAVGGSVAYYRDPANPGTDPAIAPWRRASVSPSGPVLCLTVDWADPRVAYAGADHPGVAGGIGGIYRTTDGGATWARLPGPPDNFDVVGIAIHPADAATILAATAEGGVFRTRDGGATWVLLDGYGSVGELVNVTVKHPSSPLLFVGTEGYGVQVSTDGGRTFTARNTGLTSLNVNALAFEPGSATVLYAGTDAGIFKSTDTGNTWAPTAQGAGEITDLATDAEGAVRRIWGTVKGQGVAYSADGGATFAVYSNGLASLDLTSLELEIIGSIRRIWGTTRGGDGVYYSDDLGQTWESAGGSGLADHDVTDFTYESSAVRRIWGTVRRIWATTESGAFYSDNDGLSWTELSLGLPSGVPLTSVSIDPHSNEVMVSLFSDREGGVYRGANLTGLWSPFSDGLDELKVRRLTRDGGRTIDPTTKATTFYAATAGDGSYASEVRTTSGTSPAITTTSLPGGTLHVPYTQTLGASGGSPPYSWSVPEGLLPPGLRLSASTGAVSGEPGRAGVFGFSVQVSDAQGRLDRRPFTVEIRDPNIPTVASFSPAAGPVGAAVTVVGTGFAGATAVAFGGVLATFAVESASSIRTTVPDGARTGPISVTSASGTGRSAASFAVIAPPPPGLDFYTVAPCRLVDTRRPIGGLGGPALVAGQDRTFTLVGECTIPPEAKALSLNVTVTAPTAQGNLRLYPAGIPLPTASTVNYVAGQTRANNAIAALGADGRLSVRCTQPGGGTAHLVLDVNGYFR
jgi:photosystem II stability/assembly factor-like uncharacterized protein